MKKDHPATYSPILRQQILLRNQNNLNPTLQYGINSMHLPVNQPIGAKQISMPQELYR